MSEGAQQEARIFPVESHFQKMARRPGGVPRDKAIENAQANIEKAKPGFDEWLEGELQALIGLVKRAEAGDLERKAIDDAAFRSRQIRDVGSTMGFDLLSFVANSLCEVFDATGAGAQYPKDTIDCHVEALLLARQPGYRGLRPEQLEELTGGLRRVVKRVGISPQ
jgi:hypothetical protein